jgi:uncharacterized protein involved in exopolysaccharide biosynthesis
VPPPEPAPAPGVPPPEPAPAPAVPPPEPAPAPGPLFAGPLESALRHPLLFLLLLALAIGGAVAYGLERDPVYTAEATVNVGRANVPAYTLQGVLIGNATLAAGYARVADAEPVVAGAARGSGVSLSEARGALSASPVPGTTVIRVEGALEDRARAVVLANGGARSLISYVSSLNSQGVDAVRDLLSAYRGQLKRLEHAKDRVARLSSRRNRDEDAIGRAERDEAVARLQASTFGNQYRSARGTAASESSLQLIAPAVTAKSDRGDVLQRSVIIGIAAGLILAFALCLLVTNRSLLRRRRP